MKKNIFVILFLLIASTSYAQDITTNVFASWMSVGRTMRTMYLPLPSRHLTIINGANQCVPTEKCKVWVSPRGDNITLQAPSINNYLFELPPGEQITLYNFVTTQITFLASVSTASPISVISTY